MPPKIDHLDIPAVLADIEAAESVSLPELGAKIGMGDQARRFAISEGLIETQPITAKKPGRPGHKVTRDEALTLLLAAALAIAAGVAITVMLRGVKQSGLTGPAAAATLHSMTS